MQILRTPDERFVNLRDWPYEPHYTDVQHGNDVLRIAHIDAGPRDAKNVVLCMHGEPSWSYLYRKMIPVLVGAGHRVIAPDLVGFGRSDKPAAVSDYTYERHVQWMTDWLLANDLLRLTLVCQDWGGLIGLRLLAAHPERFDRLVVANTFLPVGDRPPSEAFMAWRKYSQETPNFNVGRIVEGAVRANRSPPKWWPRTMRRSPTTHLSRGPASSPRWCRSVSMTRRRRRIWRRGRCSSASRSRR